MNPRTERVRALAGKKRPAEIAAELGITTRAVWSLAARNGFSVKFGGRETDWTDERLVTLRELHAEGLSFGEIKARLNKKHQSSFSRSAVIGKAHRLGLVRGHTPAGGGKTTNPHAAPKAPKVKRAPYQSAGHNFGTRRTFKPQPIPQSPDEPGMIKLLDLRNCHCRWPVGDPKSDDFRFCGRNIVRGAYCVGHAARAYTGLVAQAKRAA